MNYKQKLKEDLKSVLEDLEELTETDDRLHAMIKESVPAEYKSISKDVK